ncbi:low-specificity L-threonine aldolase [Desulforamulus aquiferis]|uniref:Low-specificity L-threonine aldolase n=1 Tax=Desulforamulus aquiferis TaxID=1397668 RepID=A0AAW7ZGB7_9FIRM|nr:low-specificity L-threonine aldolase [Desulforamulus aquiferis]MDO7788061.1 low-specificity L-threonine aldolase [Desulforamulus aquiferis]
MIKIKAIDLRSDTVTLPTNEMRAAMASAPVGDDVYGEDPTVRELEKKAAALMGKESALFVPSGTMGNQIAVLVHTKRGEEVILDSEAHIYYYEAGGPALLAGVQLNPVKGLLTPQGPEILKETLKPEDIHFPKTSLVCLENTFNRGGGTVLAPATMEELYGICHRQDLKVHLDGARIFNAAISLNINVKELTCCCDSVMFCLSKGLSAPVGSLLAGTSEFIDAARKYRKILGGGMRQAGVLAAAGLIALQSVDRLKEDHANALRLATGLSSIPGISIDLQRVQTNIIVVKVEGKISASVLVDKLSVQHIKCATFGPGIIRMVTHKDVSSQDIDFVISTTKDLLN